MEKLRYSEAFYSVQGEGKFVGVPSVFLRTFGCNFRCMNFGLGKDEPSRAEKLKQMATIQSRSIRLIRSDGIIAKTEKFKICLLSIQAVILMQVSIQNLNT